MRLSKVLLAAIAAGTTPDNGLIDKSRELVERYRIAKDMRGLEELAFDLLREIQKFQNRLLSTDANDQRRWLIVVNAALHALEPILVPSATGLGKGPYEGPLSPFGVASSYWPPEVVRVRPGPLLREAARLSTEPRDRRLYLLAAHVIQLFFGIRWIGSNLINPKGDQLLRFPQQVPDEIPHMSRLISFAAALINLQDISLTELERVS